MSPSERNKMYSKSFLTAFFALFLSASLSYATCPYGDAFWDKRDYERAEEYYISCAKNNNSDALYKLGLIYKDGYVEGQKDLVKGLSFLRFSAENGYAPAQRELGLSLVNLSKDEQGLKTIDEYQKKIPTISGKSKILGNIKKTNLSPYTWILLAAEKAENKWYYPAEAISDEEAIQFIQKLNMDDAIKKTVMTEAREWKMKKLRSTAKEILSKDEYQTFEQAIFSNQSTPDARASAMGYLKQKIEARKK